jgi:hypothetical protein
MQQLSFVGLGARAVTWIALPTTKNALAFVPVGPADAQGEFLIGRDELDRLRRQATNLGLIDYGTPLNELYVRVLNRADIARCRDGYATWKSADVFPDELPDVA